MLAILITYISLFQMGGSRASAETQRTVEQNEQIKLYIQLLIYPKIQIKCLHATNSCLSLNSFRFAKRLKVLSLN